MGEPSEVLHLDEVSPPTAGDGEVLIQVDAAALNFPDVLLCRGTYQERPSLPFTPGLEVAGRVVAAGRGASVATGSRVIAMPRLPHGGLAELVAVSADAVLPIPDTLSAVAAAALPVTYQTGYAGLHRRAQLRAGETLLVHGGAGGVGSAAIQLGLVAGARVIATAGGSHHTDVCRQLGSDAVIDYDTDDFVTAVKDLTSGRGADVIYDPIGGEVFDRSRRCIAFEGRLLVIGFVGGRIAEVPTNHVLIKNYSVLGLHWGLYRTMLPDFALSGSQDQVSIGVDA